MRPSRRHRGPTPLPCPIYVCRPRPCDPGAMCAPPTAWILGLVGLNFRQSRAVKYGRSISYKVQSVRCELKPYSKVVPYTCLRGSARRSRACHGACSVAPPRPAPRHAERARPRFIGSCSLRTCTSWCTSQRSSRDAWDANGRMWTHG